MMHGHAMQREGNWMLKNSYLLTKFSISALKENNCWKDPKAAILLPFIAYIVYQKRGVGMCVY